MWLKCGTARRVLCWSQDSTLLQCYVLSYSWLLDTALRLLEKSPNVNPTTVQREPWIPRSAGPPELTVCHDTHNVDYTLSYRTQKMRIFWMAKLRKFRDLTPCSQVDIHRRFAKICSLHFYARLQNCEKRLLSSSCPSVRPLPLGGFSWNLSLSSFFFPKSVDKFKVSLQCSKNNGYFTRNRFYIYDSIFQNYSLNEKYCR